MSLPRSLDAQRFFDGAALWSFLACFCFFPRAFLMFFQLVLGLSGGTFELFGTLWDLCCKLLGPLSGISGSFLDLCEPRWASCAALGPVLGCSWASLRGPLGPRCGEAATRCAKMNPKVAQEPQNGPPKNNYSCIFGGPFLGRFQHSLSEGFLDAWLLKGDDFTSDLLQKRCFSPVTLKNNKSRKKVMKERSKIGAKTVQSRV